jgi:hypothetical protein
MLTPAKIIDIVCASTIHLTVMDIGEVKKRVWGAHPPSPLLPCPAYALNDYALDSTR